MLHHNSKLLKDPNALQFFAVADTIREIQPKCIILENVKGIMRVIKKVTNHLAKTGPYHIEVLHLNPHELACDMQRSRVYILMLHEAEIKKH